MIYPSNQYREKMIHPHAHEMLHRISDATYIHMNPLVGMYIAHEAHLLDTMGRYAYMELREPAFDEAETMILFFEPSDSKKYTGRVKISQVYLAKLNEIAWAINVSPKEFLNTVIAAEYEIFVNSNKESYKSYMTRLGEYRDEMNKVFDPLTTCIYKTRKQTAGGNTFDGGNTIDGEYTWRETGFVPANELKKQGGDSLL